MKVKSYWVEQSNFAIPVKPGLPVVLINPFNGTGQVIGKIDRVDETRALLVLNEAVPWQSLEEQGVGFSQFEDTED